MGSTAGGTHAIDITLDHCAVISSLHPHGRAYGIKLVKPVFGYGFERFK